jgi:hypothetical protein
VAELVGLAEQLVEAGLDLLAEFVEHASGRSFTRLAAGWLLQALPNGVRAPARRSLREGF